MKSFVKKFQSRQSANVWRIHAQQLDFNPTKDRDLILYITAGITPVLRIILNTPVIYTIVFVTDNKLF